MHELWLDQSLSRIDGGCTDGSNPDTLRGPIYGELDSYLIPIFLY